jgi:hypothetical protein
MFQAIDGFVTAHPYVTSMLTVVAAHIWQAFVNMWESPDETSSKGYRRWFKFINALQLNFKRMNAGEPSRP